MSTDYFIDFDTKYRRYVKIAAIFFVQSSNSKGVQSDSPVTRGNFVLTSVENIPPPKIQLSDFSGYHSSEEMMPFF